MMTILMVRGSVVEQHDLYTGGNRTFFSVPLRRS